MIKKKKAALLSQSQLTKDYTREEYQALPASARNQIIAHKWASNEIMAYFVPNRDGYTIEFDKAEIVKNLKNVTPLADIESVTVLATVDEDDEDDNCTNCPQVLSIISYAKKFGLKSFTPDI